ncbi:hypothetical protein [uncultured Psychroserpens sp.]|uniref:hypothetical protein n=1 Tax=uncultured Psychroserpens sp. TaxID=255436 RepID=UPI0026302E16|nr:hypothetical protein [uncultured Psychroserpens sp.]
MRAIIFVLSISIILLSCKQENKNNNVLKDDVAKTEVSKDSNDKFKIVKIDSIANLYLIYASKQEKYYKIISKKTDSINGNCDRINYSSLYNFKLDTLYNYREFFGQHVDGVEIEEVTVYFEKDSIMELYGSNNIKGLCYEK